MEFQRITLEELKKHNKPEDLWIVIEGNVYDVTKFRNEHPGGEETLDEAGGTDATLKFNEVGHSQEAKQMLKKYWIGAFVEEKSVGPSVISVGIYGLIAYFVGLVAVRLFRNYIGRK